MKRKDILKALRLHAGFSVSVAAKLAHTDRRQWRRWESGEAPVSEATIHFVCMLLAMPYPPDVAALTTRNIPPPLHDNVMPIAAGKSWATANVPAAFVDDDEFPEQIVIEC